MGKENKGLANVEWTGCSSADFHSRIRRSDPVSWAHCCKTASDCSSATGTKENPRKKAGLGTVWFIQVNPYINSCTRCCIRASNASLAFCNDSRKQKSEAPSHEHVYIDTLSVPVRDYSLA